MLSIGFRVLVSRHPAIQTTGLLTLAPAGLSPAEHASLRWTHGRVGDWRAGLGRSLCSLLARSFVCECHTISTVPRFQPPPRRTQHADLSGSSAIAGFRPHRSHRAALPQWALQKGPEAGRSLLPCLVDHRFREGEGSQQLAVSRPGHAALLAAFAERFAPLPDDAVLEHAH